MGDGSTTLFYRAPWLEGIPFNVRFNRLYELVENKLAIVDEMHSLGWGLVVRHESCVRGYLLMRRSKWRECSKMVRFIALWVGEEDRWV